MVAFESAWVFLKSDVLEKDYRAAQRAARKHGLPDATTSAIFHPMGDIDSQMAPRYSPDMDEPEMDDVDEKEQKKQRMLRLLEQMRGNRAAM